MRELHLSDNWIRSAGFYYLLSAVANSPQTYPILGNMADDRETLEQKKDSTKDRLDLYALWLRINNNYISPREVLFIAKDESIPAQVVEGTFKRKGAVGQEKLFVKTNINTALDLKQPKVSGAGSPAVMFKPMEQTGDWKKDQETMTKKASAYNKSLEVAKCENSASYLPYVRYQFKTDATTSQEDGPSGEYNARLFTRVGAGGAGGSPTTKEADEESDSDSDDEGKGKGKGAKGGKDA